MRLPKSKVPIQGAQNPKITITTWTHMRSRNMIAPSFMPFSLWDGYFALAVPF
jgi:hypothetical protein